MFYFRLPDEIHKRMKVNKDLNLTIRWAIGYIKEWHSLDESTMKLLHLCAQELNLVDRDSDYFNPYRIVKKAAKRFEDPPPSHRIRPPLVILSFRIGHSTSFDDATIKSLC